METTTNSQEETIEAGRQLAAHFQGGDILLLNGELGAGKTTFVKGLAAGLNITDEITSPTFTLMNVYSAHFGSIKKLVHIDTYRLKNESDLIDIGIEDYLADPETLCIVEWPEKITNLLTNKKTIVMTIESVSENKRKITLN